QGCQSDQRLRRLRCAAWPLALDDRSEALPAPGGQRQIDVQVEVLGLGALPEELAVEPFGLLESTGLEEPPGLCRLQVRLKIDEVFVVLEEGQHLGRRRLGW